MPALLTIALGLLLLDVLRCFGILLDGYGSFWRISATVVRALVSAGLAAWAAFLLLSH